MWRAPTTSTAAGTCSTCAGRQTTRSSPGVCGLSEPAIDQGGSWRRQHTGARGGRADLVCVCRAERGGVQRLCMRGRLRLPQYSGRSRVPARARHSRAVRVTHRKIEMGWWCKLRVTRSVLHAASFCYLPRLSTCSLMYGDAEYIANW